MSTTKLYITLFRTLDVPQPPFGIRPAFLWFNTSNPGAPKPYFEFDFDDINPERLTTADEDRIVRTIETAVRCYRSIRNTDFRVIEARIYLQPPSTLELMGEEPPFLVVGLAE
jgi:hypothetical protein